MERRADLVPVAILNLLGVSLLVAGWWAAANRADLASQVPFVALAAVGLLTAAMGDVVALVALRRSVDERSVVVNALLVERFAGRDE